MSPPPPPLAPANIVPVQQGSEAECIAGVGIPPGSSVKWVPLIVPPYGSTPYLAVSLLHVRVLVSRGVLCHVVSCVTWYLVSRGVSRGVLVSRGILCHVVSCVTWYLVSRDVLVSRGILLLLFSPLGLIFLKSLSL